MAGIGQLLEMLRETHARIAEAESIAAQFPGDRSVLINLASLKRAARELEDQWEEYCRASATEVCKYRIIQPNNKFSLSWFSKSLLEFQNLFTQIFDAKKNGAKARATVSAETWNDTSFDFAFSFPGSLGVALTIQGERGLDLFNGSYDEAIDAFMDAVTITDEHEVRDTAKMLGNAVVKRIYEWSSANVKADFGVDISWTTPKGIKKGGYIDNNTMHKLVSVISQTSDLARSNVSVLGTLVGLDSKTKHFRFASLGEDKIYSGKAHEDFDILKDWKLNTNYVAEVAVETTTSYATQETKETFKLKDLSPLQTE